MKRRSSPQKQTGGLLTAAPFLLPSLIGMLIFSMLPLIISALISLTDWNGLAKLTGPGFFREHFIGLENYKKILTSAEFWRTLGNTAEYIILYIPLMLAASLLVATLLSQARRGIGFFRVMYYIPVLTSWVAASLIWKSVLSPPVWRTEWHSFHLRHPGPRLADRRKVGHARHCAGVRLEGYGLLRSDPAVRRDRHQQDLL